jgi:hypothetical protein
MDIKPTLRVDPYSPSIDKVKMLLPHHVPQKEHEQYWDPFLLKLPAQDVYQDIVIHPCNVQKCRQNLICQMKSRLDLGGQHRQAVPLPFLKPKWVPMVTDLKIFKVFFFHILSFFI